MAKELTVTERAQNALSIEHTEAELLDWLTEHASLGAFEEYTEQEKDAYNNSMEALNMEAEQAKVRLHKEEIERGEREKEQEKLADERAEADKVCQEKESLEAKQCEADEKQRPEDEAKAEVARQEVLRPDVEKVEAWAAEIRFIEGPSVEDESCQQLINEALRGLGAVSNKLFAGIKKSKTA